MKEGKYITICCMALGFLQMVPSVPPLKENGFYSIFTQVLQNLHTSLVCQVGVGMFTPLFNLPHLPCIPTSCTLCFILCHGETAQCCGAASGFIYSSLVFSCKQLPMILTLGEFSVQAGNLCYLSFSTWL